jgi:hypothetical protein
MSKDSSPNLFRMLLRCFPEQASADEDKEARKRKKENKPRKSEQPPLAPKMLLEFEASPHAQPFKPVVKKIQDLFFDANHLCSDPSKPCRCKGPGEQKLLLDAQEQRKRDQENPLARPDEHSIFNAILARMQPTQLSLEMADQLTPEQVLDKIQKGEASLYCLKASFENKLLCEAGNFICEEAKGGLRNFPPCKLQEKCCCYRDFKFICTAIMWPHEYHNFMEKNEAPATERVCILDHRLSISDIVFAQRQHVETHKPSIIKNDCLLQMYRNNSECEEGYYDRDVLVHPVSYRWEGIVGAIPTYRKHRLLARQKPTGQRYIDQSAMIWKQPQPIQPAMGESSRDF